MSGVNRNRLGDSTAVPIHPGLRLLLLSHLPIIPLLSLPRLSGSHEITLQENGDGYDQYDEDNDHHGGVIGPRNT